MIAQNFNEKFETSPSAEIIKKSARRTADRAFCLKCGRQVKLVGYNQAAESFKTDVEDIGKLAESRQLHRIHNQSGETMICSDSLFTLFESRQTRRLNPDLLRLNSADYKTSEDLQA